MPVSGYEATLTAQLLEDFIESLPVDVGAAFAAEDMKFQIDDCGAITLKIRDTMPTQLVELVEELLFEYMEKKKTLPRYFLLERAQ